MTTPGWITTSMCGSWIKMRKSVIAKKKLLAFVMFQLTDGLARDLEMMDRVFFPCYTLRCYLSL